MSAPTERWKQWEGRLIEGKFPLRKWLGGSGHSAVFLTERGGVQPQKTVIKLIAAQNVDAAAQLSRWAEAGKLSHPHLIRLFECGRCQIDDADLLYVVMEYADENLAEIIPVRPLLANEALEMLRPATEGLVFLQRAGFVHGHIKPSNVVAVENQLKLSADGLRKIGERGDARVSSPYDAPEVASAGFTAASDVWSLGMTLMAVLTQNEPKSISGDRQVELPEGIPQPLRGIVQQCVQSDPAKRYTLNDIRMQISPRASRVERPAVPAAAPAQTHDLQRGSKRWIVPVVIVTLILLVWIGRRVGKHQPEDGSAAQSLISQPGNTNTNAATSEPSAAKQVAPRNGVTRGSVLQQVMPEVSPSALHTVTGRLKVGVQVTVDASGKVSNARLISAGPSRYFAERALAAARRWRFNPAQVNGEARGSEWILRFQFARTSTQVFPTEIKP